MSLQLATNGFLPLCVIGLATNGFMACDGIPLPEPEEGGGGKKKRAKKVYVFEDSPFVHFNDETDYIRVIRGNTEQVETETEGAIISHEALTHKNKTPPLVNPVELTEIEDTTDREIALLMRIEEIKRHALIERLYAEELRKLEEELTVLMLLI